MVYVNLCWRYPHSLAEAELFSVAVPWYSNVQDELKASLCG